MVVADYLYIHAFTEMGIFLLKPCFQDLRVSGVVLENFLGLMRNFICNYNLSFTLLAPMAVL